MNRVVIDKKDLIRHIELAWIKGVSMDYQRGLLWSGEFSVSVSLAYHLRRMYLDYQHSLRMWFEVAIADVGQIDITISEVPPDFKGFDYDFVTSIDRHDLIAIEMKYAGKGAKGVKGDIEKLEGLMEKPEYAEIIPIVAYVDFNGDDKNDTPSLETILSYLKDSPVGLLYGHPYKHDAWSSHNIAV